MKLPYIIDLCFNPFHIGSDFLAWIAGKWIYMIFFPHWLLLQGHDSITEMKHELRKHTQLSAFRKQMEDWSGSIPEVRIQEFSE